VLFQLVGAAEPSETNLKIAYWDALSMMRAWDSFENDSFNSCYPRLTLKLLHCLFVRRVLAKIFKFMMQSEVSSQVNMKKPTATINITLPGLQDGEGYSGKIAGFFFSKM
jgi:hypothetical protein